MAPLDRDRDGRAWLFSSPGNPSIGQIRGSLRFSGPATALMATHCDSEKRLFSDVAAQFPLPDYFGHNWDALDECVFTESFEGRLIVISDISERAEGNLARFIDLFQFVWVPEPQARDWYPSLFDARWKPGRVAIVVAGFQGESMVASWPDASRVYRPAPLDLTPPAGDIAAR